MRVVLACCALACAFLATPASAQLAIDRLWVDFEPGTPNRADLIIRNESTDRYYITVSPVEVKDAGAADEQRVETADPEQLGLLVSPNRLVLDPGSMRAIRVVSLNTQVASDRVYRIRVTPQVGDIETEATSGDARGMTVKLLTAYDILVTVRPNKPDANLVAVREAGDLVIRNQGNTNTLLFDGAACPAGSSSATPDACEDLGARRLYAGNEWRIPLKDAQAKVRFKERRFAGADPREVAY